MHHFWNAVSTPWALNGERWSSRLVATASENRLSFRRNSHTSFAAASDCRTIAIYEYTALVVFTLRSDNRTIKKKAAKAVWLEICNRTVKGKDRGKCEKH
jgi:hypothetical protein